jgi:predicted O-methyltransferase YrrM
MVVITMIIRLVVYGAMIIFKRKRRQFITNFRQNVLIPEQNTAIQTVINCQKRLASDHRIMARDEWGAGSRVSDSARTVAMKAATISVNRKSGLLLFHLAQYYRPEFIIELGTAFGISTLWLAEGNPGAKIITVEGNPAMAEIAREHFALYKKNNIQIINSDFDEVLHDLCDKMTMNSLVFIDGNHTFEATLRYFNKFREKARIIVLDDILWSADMIRAWHTIVQMDAGATIDLLRTGIVFPGEEHQKYAFWF